MKKIQIKKDKNIFLIFFLYIEMTNNYYKKKNKEKLQKEAREWYQNLSEKGKTKRDSMHVSDIEIFLKQKKKRSVNMVMDDMRIF